MNNTVIKNNSTIVIAITRIYAIIVLLVHIFCIYKYSMGISYAFGNIVSITESVEMIFGILSMSGGYYRGICNALLGLLYLVIFVFMVKKFIASLTSFRSIFKEKLLTENSKYTIASYGKHIGSSLFLAIAFTFISATVKDFKLGKDVYVLMAIWAFLTVLTKVVCSLQENYTWQTVLIKGVYDIIAIISISLVLFLSKYPSVEKLIYAIKGLTVFPIQSFLSMIIPVIYGVLMIMALCMIKDAANENIVLQNHEMIKQAKRLIYVSVLLGIGAVVVLVWGGYTSRLDFEKIVAIFMPYISVICASVSTLIATMFPTDYIKKNNFDEKNAHLYTIDENGILSINEGVTEIRSFAFQDRTDIIEVFIPASVMFIDRKAFLGCDNNKIIHCQHSEQPSAWSSKWTEGCDATIDWNQK